MSLNVTVILRGYGNLQHAITLIGKEFVCGFDFVEPKAVGDKRFQVDAS
jgi:hypothetical protein